jgi:hypothetical protein
MNIIIEIQDVSCPNQMLVATLFKKGINIPFYDIIEMKNILLENKNA